MSSWPSFRYEEGTKVGILRHLDTPSEDSTGSEGEITGECEPAWAGHQGRVHEGAGKVAGEAAGQSLL